jgi:hypothetical protein
MQERELKRGYRNAWFLALLGAVYIAIFFALATSTSLPGEDRVEWNMGGAEFVPASSAEAEGYYKPVTEEDWLEFGKEEQQ